MAAYPPEPGGTPVRVTPAAIVRWALMMLGAGIAVAALGHGTTLRAIGLTLGGIACVALVSAAFYAVGLSEDRDREREREERARRG
jgi:hypothetical protein